MRKVIQISTNGLENTSVTQSSWAVYALCDDGTMWEAWGGRKWEQLPPIPQDEVAPVSGAGGVV